MSLKDMEKSAETSQRLKDKEAKQWNTDKLKDLLASLLEETMHTLTVGKHSGSALALELYEITYPDESTASVRIQLKTIAPASGGVSISMETNTPTTEPQTYGQSANTMESRRS